MERLAEEYNTLCGDLQRREAMINQRDGVIVELRDEACTLWASGWLTFRRIATKVFPGLDFNLQVPDEEEAKESVSEDKADPEVFSKAPISVPYPGEVETPVKDGSSPSPAVDLPSDSHGSEARTTKAARSSPSNIGFVILWIFVLLPWFSRLLLLLMLKGFLVTQSLNGRVLIELCGC